MWHDSSCGKKKENLNVLKKSSALYEALISNQQLFSSERKSVMYTMASRGEPRVWFCATDGWDTECTAGPETIRSRPPGWSQAWSLPFGFYFSLRQQDPHTPIWKQIPDTPIFKLAARPEVVSRFFFPQRPTLEGNKQCPRNTSTTHSIQTEGARDCCPPKNRFRCSS